MIYFDKNGVEITEGCKIQYEDGRVEMVYLADDGRFGVDATNPKWIENGRADPCEYGIYPLNHEELNKVEVIEAHLSF